MKAYKNIILVLIIMCISICLCSCYDEYPIEELSIITGVGYDIEKGAEINLVDPAETISIKEDDGEGGSLILVGRGPTLYSLVENRISKQHKTIVFGAEVLYLISEERAKFGIKDALDDLLRYPDLNINAMVVICKGKCEEFLSLKPESSTMSEDLFRMIKYCHQGSFYSSHVTVNDLLLMYHQNGRQIFLPYIEIVEGKPQLTGTAIFNDDKMVNKVPIKESKLINLLRNSGSKGALSIRSENLLSYIDIVGTNKVKIKVLKKKKQLEELMKEQFIYDIYVNITADLLVDTLSETELNKKQISKIEKIFEVRLEKDLNNEVKKIQEEYEVDCLDIGKYALAKYGRESGYDSNEYFSNAQIKVHATVKIDSIGRIHSTHIED
ncbi:Ger(x)C family spore germination protein [Oceanirhabdus sp. W0125-5]|uniref:Ger(x)C family spore germination protein n=1 Tax=Oceanirhabdus sp. W0125-5 TaxID=2999116 RepID=UPI0022F33E9F|nr:Ger(x)C family spore germination protein [Oceanirhabdus sp. W0125-5]WBW95642.1 Ger(x)C family spore germination protein [Oceanirhabdus sp. W0125-5]